MDTTPIPLRMYLIQGFYKGASEVSWVIAACAFLFFVFSLQGEAGPGGTSSYSFRPVGVTQEAGQ